jgi:hypothetical protein
VAGRLLMVLLPFGANTSQLSRAAAEVLLAERQRVADAASSSRRVDSRSAGAMQQSAAPGAVAAPSGAQEIF